jgi:hypothetical protein
VRLLAVILLMVATAQARAEVIVPPEHRVANEMPGWCGWKCLEMIGGRQGVEALAGLTERRKKAGRTHLCSDSNVRSQLQELGVKYRIRLTGSDKVKGFKAVSSEIKAGRPVMVGVQFPAGGHAVLLTELTSEVAKFVDPNNIGVTATVPQQFFMLIWDGFALSVVN